MHNCIPTPGSAMDIIARQMLENARPSRAPSDETYVKAALDAYLTLVFKDQKTSDEAIDEVYSAVIELGFTGTLFFGYDPANANEAGPEAMSPDGQEVTGPYMAVRTSATEQLRVLPIGVDPKRIGWLAGNAD